MSLTFAGETSSDFDPSFPCQVFNLNNLVEQIICAKENKIFFTIFINRPRYSTLRQHTNHMNEVLTIYSRLEASCDLQHEKNWREKLTQITCYGAVKRSEPALTPTHKHITLASSPNRDIKTSRSKNGITRG